MRILVAEQLAREGIEILRAHHEVDELVGVWGMRVEDIIVDCLTFPIATGQEETRRDAIETIEPSDNTAAEARHVRDLAASRKMSRVIIVTSKQHTRRARLVMQRRLAPVGTQVIMRGSKYDRAVLTSWWWRDRATFRFTLFETQRLLGYWIGVVD